MNFELPIAVERITSAVAGKECKSPPELDQAGFVKIIPVTKAFCGTGAKNPSPQR